MKTLYIDCAMGAAGDMLAAALLELLPDRESFLEKLNAIGLPGVTFAARRCVKSGIAGTRLEVTVQGVSEAPEPETGHSHRAHNMQDGRGHSHRSLAGIEDCIRGLRVSEWVRENAVSVYRAIADAESRVHGAPVSEVHFHEVGALDAVADVIAVCMLLEALGAERIAASPVCTGSGTVRCAHGVLPVPAPATALLLRDIPIYPGELRSELCTPTGAALLRHFATAFGDMPPMRLKALGYGMGTKDFPGVPNCLRVLLGETEPFSGGGEQVWELACNLDDMTPEDVAYAQALLLEKGALDAYTVPIGMKKGRPGLMLCCLCPAGKQEDFAGLLLRHTTTLGVRFYPLERRTLQRRTETRATPWGSVRVKTAEGFGVCREKPEFDDLAEIAEKTGRSMAEVRRGVLEKEWSTGCDMPEPES